MYIMLQSLFLCVCVCVLVCVCGFKVCTANWALDHISIGEDLMSDYDGRNVSVAFGQKRCLAEKGNDAVTTESYGRVGL